MVDHGALFIEADGMMISYIALEFMEDAAPLSSIADNRGSASFQPLTSEEEAAILSGLRQINASGVLHGDVSPLNVLISGASLPAGQRRFFWIDFGNSYVAPCSPPPESEGQISIHPFVDSEEGECRQMLDDLRSTCASLPLGGQSMATTH